MVSFVCNICGAHNDVEQFATEPATCACGSNVRIRALIHLLSMELFDHSIPLVDFPVLKSIRGLGMSDKEGYAAILSEKFDYTNTYYEREPRFDFTVVHPDRYGTVDFVLSADVLEHIAPPVERALDEVAKILKPHGFLGITVFCHPSDNLREHFPELHEYRTVILGDSIVLINRRADGALEIRDDIVFHGGTGATLEMREFGISSLKSKLLASGFRDVHLMLDNIPGFGILFDRDVSQPLLARKDRFMLTNLSAHELVNRIHALEMERDNLQAESAKLKELLEQAGGSRWIRLGRKLGLGPVLK